MARNGFVTNVTHIKIYCTFYMLHAGFQTAENIFKKYASVYAILQEKKYKLLNKKTH